MEVEDRDENEHYVPYIERPETYIVPALFSLIYVFGILGNGTLIYIFVRNRRMRNIPNTYIFSMAFGDLLLIFTCVPFTSTVYTLESWPYGEIMCKLGEFTKDLSVGVSVFNLIALSVERYSALVNPMRHYSERSFSTRKVTIGTVFGIWILAIALAIPSATFSRLREHVLSGNHSVIISCYPFPGEIGDTPDKILIITKFLAYYGIPLCAITFFYVLISINLERSVRQMPSEASVSTSSHIKSRKKVAKIVLVFVIIFVLCFLPHHIFMLWFHLNPNSLNDYDELWHALRIIGFCFSYLNSCINPIALYCVSGTFRKYFNKYLFCLCYNEKANVDSMVSGSMMRKSKRNHESSHTVACIENSVDRSQKETTTASLNG